MTVGVSDTGGSGSGARQAFSGYPARLWWLGVSGVLMVVGSLGVWAKTEIVGTTLESSPGVERLGWVALGVGGAASVAAFVFARSRQRPRPRWPVAVCAAAGIAGAAVALYEWVEIESSDEALGAYQSSGWGLYLTWVAAISLFVASVVVLGRDTSVGVSLALFSVRHGWLVGAARWIVIALLGLDVVMLVALGQGLVSTGPETETLGQGTVGVFLIFGAFALFGVTVLAYWFPRAAGLLLLVIGVPLAAAFSSVGWGDCDPNCWVSDDRQGELTGLASAIANSPALSLSMFLLPPLAGLALLITGFVRRHPTPPATSPTPPPHAPAPTQTATADRTADVPDTGAWLASEIIRIRRLLDRGDTEASIRDLSEAERIASAQGYPEILPEIRELAEEIASASDGATQRRAQRLITRIDQRHPATGAR